MIYLLERVRGLGRTIAIILLIIIALDYHLIQIKNYQKKDFRKLAQEVKTIAKKDDPIYVSSELDFFTAKYYLPDHQLFIYNKTYAEIPDFVGKVLISRSDIASSLPRFPKKAFLLKSDGTYNIQALY